MNNNVSTLENVYTTRKHKLYWRSDEGMFRYIPGNGDKFTLTVYEPDGTVFGTYECKVEDGEILIEFPDDAPAGFYTYDIAWKKEDKTLLKTEGTFHVGRR